MHLVHVTAGYGQLQELVTAKRHMSGDVSAAHMMWILKSRRRKVFIVGVSSSQPEPVASDARQFQSLGKRCRKAIEAWPVGRVTDKLRSISLSAMLTSTCAACESLPMRL